VAGDRVDPVEILKFGCRDVGPIRPHLTHWCVPIGACAAGRTNSIQEFIKMSLCPG
jgi:hypothetical protein